MSRLGAPHVSPTSWPGLLVVRKLGVPGHSELAMRAIAGGGVRVLNEDVVCELGIATEVIDAVARQEQQLLERREHLYRDGQPAQKMRGRTAILVDDGLATASTMRAAVSAVRQQQPARIVVAVPTASPEICEDFQKEVDECVCTLMPQHFRAVGRWYQDFEEVPDEEVCALLESAAHEAARRRTRSHENNG